LCSRILLRALKKKPRLVGGADVAYSKKADVLFAAILVFRYPTMELVEVSSARGPAPIPYIPGLLSFREIPVLLKAVEGLERCFDVLICDGQGIAHPRRLGLASHLGLLLDLPTVGCAKSRLVGKYAAVGEEAGSISEIIHKEKTVGAVVRTREKVKPVFVSPGYKIDLKGALSVVLGSVRGYRIPEPLRQAHLTVSRLRKEEEG
jgi:deoxyribonuclease V